MDRFADLHTHTFHSDGLYAPAEVIDRAATSGLSIVAISDHDNLAAIAEVSAYARKKGLTLIPATELSCQHRGIDIHILAYGVDPANERLGRRLESFRRTRENRGELMVEKLIGLGYALDIERVKELAGDGSLGRPHVARALVEIGAVESINEAFEKFLRQGRPGWVEKERFLVDEAVDVVRAAGGVTAIAHPTLYPNHREVVDELLAAGIGGIETRHPEVDDESRAYYEELAKHRGLLTTGGSDDHGQGGSKTIGNIRVPENMIAPILELVR